MSNILDVSPANVVRQLLVDLSLGTNVTDARSWPVFAVQEPNSPDDAITVYDTTPRVTGRTMVDGEVQQGFGFQVQVRSATHDAGFTKINAILDSLAKDVALAAVTVSAKTYLVWAVMNFGGVLSLGEEPESKRRLFTLNAQAAIEQLN